MSSSYVIAPATLDHAQELALTMREADVREIWASSHREPLEALQGSMRRTIDPFTGLAGGEVICMFGVAPLTLLSDIGVPWLLCSKTLKMHAKAFLRISRNVLNVYRDSYPILTNFVDARNTSAVRWLEWAGFSLYAPQPYGVEKRPFHRFEMTRV